MHDLIARHEGKRLKPYKDTVGKLTIGYGRNLDDVGISGEEADAMLWRDIERAIAAGLRYSWFKGLSEVRMAVVVDMIYNLGPGGFRSFVNMRAALKAHRWADASRAMLNSKWAVQVPTRAKRLAKMMRADMWPN